MPIDFRKLKKRNKETTSVEEETKTVDLSKDKKVSATVIPKEEKRDEYKFAVSLDK
jgi:hypothetical protein